VHEVTVSFGGINAPDEVSVEVAGVVLLRNGCAASGRAPGCVRAPGGAPELEEPRHGI
jgi:hypothetical protein